MSVAMIPAPAERAWLVDELVALTAAVGWQRLVGAPVLEPTPRWFPDRWTPDAAGVRRLARRLLRYAGLEQLDVQVSLFHGDRDVALDAYGHSAGERHHGAAAWFAGIEDGVCRFGAEFGQLADPLGVTAAMAHEVAHVFRRVHAVEVDDREVEERLTDLTTVLLGFGLLTTNATSRHRSAGGIGVHSWSHQMLGYLPPQAMSFLLAVQAQVRGSSSAQRRAIARHLEPNQRGFFEHACSCIERELPDLAERIGVTADVTWPEGHDLEYLCAPLDDNDDDADEPAEAPAAEYRGVNLGRPVFRIERRRTWRWAGLALLASMAGAPLLGGLLRLPVLVCGLAAAGVVAAGLAGRRVRADYCADPDCKAVLAPGLERCPRCEGTIAGTIKHPDERLEAADAYTRRRLGR